MRYRFSDMAQMIKRACLVCETELTLTVSPDGVEGGHLFGTTTEFGDEVEPPLTKNLTADGALEIWECEECFHAAENDPYRVEDTRE